MKSQDVYEIFQEGFDSGFAKGVARERARIIDALEQLESDYHGILSLEGVSEFGRLLAACSSKVLTDVRRAAGHD